MIVLDMEIEEAVKMVVSLGVVVPEWPKARKIAGDYSTAATVRWKTGLRDARGCQRLATDLTFAPFPLHK